MQTTYQSSPQKSFRKAYQSKLCSSVNCLTSMMLSQFHWQKTTLHTRPRLRTFWIGSRGRRIYPTTMLRHFVASNSSFSKHHQHQTTAPQALSSTPPNGSHCQVLRLLLPMCSSTTTRNSSMEVSPMKLKSSSLNRLWPSSRLFSIEQKFLIMKFFYIYLTLNKTIYKDQRF